MKQGSTLAIIRDTKDPKASETTQLVGALLAAGVEFASKKPLSDSIDEKGERLVSWSLDGGRKITFSNDFDPEPVTIAEFRRRFESREWCEKNPNHPIAFLRAYRDKMGGLRDFLRATPPAARIRKGRRVGLIPANATDEERKQILDALK